MKIEEFQELRYGMLIHYGPYSLLGRGEWVMNREQIPVSEYRCVADSLRGENFDADAIVRLALNSGVRYIVFTTMQCDGFRMYDSDITDYCSTRVGARRDFTAEMIAACRKHGLKVGLYHSLNQWYDTPNGADALEDPDARKRFIDATHARIAELVTRYSPFDIFWYDNPWPFDVTEWRADELNTTIRKLNPGCLINDRSGLSGDFVTSVQRAAPPAPWRPWEVAVTSNDSWGYHLGDQHWKSPLEIVNMLAGCAAGKGNLLLNVGLRGDGSIPERAAELLAETGSWLWRNGEVVYGTDLFKGDRDEVIVPDFLNQRNRSAHRSDWNHLGPVTARKDMLYQLVLRWPGSTIVIGGVQVKVRQVFIVGTNQDVSFRQEGSRLILTGLPDKPVDPLCTVFRIRCAAPPALYVGASPRIPTTSHTHYGKHSLACDNNSNNA